MVNGGLARIHHTEFMGNEEMEIKVVQTNNTVQISRCRFFRDTSHWKATDIGLCPSHPCATPPPHLPPVPLCTSPPLCHFYHWTCISLLPAHEQLFFICAECAQLWLQPALISIDCAVHMEIWLLCAKLCVSARLRGMYGIVPSPQLRCCAHEDCIQLDAVLSTSLGCAGGGGGGAQVVGNSWPPLVDCLLTSPTLPPQIGGRIRPISPICSVDLLGF